MGFLVPLAIGLATAKIGSAVSKKLTPKLDTKVEPIPTFLSTAGETEGDAAKRAADRTRRSASSRSGRSSTLLTSPRGLGEISGSNVAVKTLLGY